MDNIKVNIRSPPKRSFQHISRDHLPKFPSKSDCNAPHQRLQELRQRPEAERCVGITLQQYIRGSSPGTGGSPKEEVIKMGLKDVRLNILRQPQIQEIDQENYDEAGSNKYIIDISLPKIQGLSNPVRRKGRFRSSSRIDSYNDRPARPRQERIRTVYNQPLFFNMDRAVSSGKKSLRGTIYSSSLSRSSKEQKFPQLKGQTSYISTSAGFAIGPAKKKNKRVIKVAGKRIW